MQESRKFTNTELANILKEVVAAMEVKGANLFRLRAYQNAIVSIENLTLSVADLWESARLSDISGVGASLAQHIDELFRTGAVKEFDHAKKGLPEGMFGLLGLRGIGAKKAYKLSKAFDLNDRVTAREKLKGLAEAGKIRVLEGFGQKSEQDILEALNEAKVHKREKQRMLLITAEEISDRIVSYLKAFDVVEKVDVLGSFRRRESTIGDIDVAVATNSPAQVLDYISEFSEIKEILSRGDKKISFVLKTDVQVDVRVIEPSAYGSMLQYFTGSKQHNVILRTHALENDMSVSEYGIKRDGGLNEYATEESFYSALGLDYVPPEIRQGREEVVLATQKMLPELVKIEDIKGDIHTHTVASDGVDDLIEMVDAAVDLGYEYYGVADHAPSITSRGLKAVSSIISTQREHIEQINTSYSNITVLFGYEVNILSDATLGLPDEFLAQLDYVIASLHTSLDQDRKQMTKRLLSAIENPYVNIIGHPTGRLINDRRGIDVDWSEIFDAVLKYNKILEINAQPNRLDLPDDLVYEAIKKGIKLIINTDAHAKGGLSLMGYGVDVARRGWCTKNNIVNTLHLNEFLRLLKHANI
jgi:DNA polymerase (family X)